MPSWTADEYAAYVIRNKQSTPVKKPAEPVKKAAPVPTENAEQASLFCEAALRVDKYPELRLLLSIPNGSYKSPAARRLFKATGLKSGVPDILLPVMRPVRALAGADYDLHAGLWIELKRTKGGVVSAEQTQWIADLNEQGYLAVVCYGWRAAWAVIIEYLGEKPD